MVVTDGDGGHFVFFRRRRHRYLDHPHAQQGQPGGWVKMKGGLKYQDMKPGRCVTFAQVPARNAKWVPGFA